MVTDEEVVAQAVEWIRQVGVGIFLSGRYTTSIDPRWFATPEDRAMLWTIIAEMVRLEEIEDAG